MSMALGWLGSGFRDGRGTSPFAILGQPRRKAQPLVLWALLSSTLVASCSVQETFMSWGIPTVLRLPEHVFKVFARASARRR